MQTQYFVNVRTQAVKRSHPHFGTFRLPEIKHRLLCIPSKTLSTWTGLNELFCFSSMLKLTMNKYQSVIVPCRVLVILLLASSIRNVESKRNYHNGIGVTKMRDRLAQVSSLLPTSQTNDNHYRKQFTGMRQNRYGTLIIYEGCAWRIIRHHEV